MNQSTNELAEKLAANFLTSLEDALPGIVSALKSESGQSSFTVTVAFKRIKKKARDGIFAEMSVRARNAMPGFEHQVQISTEDQLELFDGSSADNTQ